MNTRRIIENGLYGLFTAMALVDKYAPYAALIAIVAGGIYWWPESKFVIVFFAGMVGIVIGLMALLVVIGTVARWIGYEPELPFDSGLDTPKED